MKINNEAEFNRYMDKFIKGHPEKAARILDHEIKNKIVPHAKKNHHKGRAHGMERYEDQTGTLTKAIKHLKKSEVHGDKIIGWVHVAGADYAADVEYGTYGGSLGRSGGRMGRNKPYPYMRPAIAENKEPIKQELKTGLEKYGEEFGLNG